MKKTKTILLQVFISLMPVIYFLSIWNVLPNVVPIHFDSNFIADDFGSKYEMLGVLLFMFSVSIGTSLLILNLDKLDPKQRYANNHSLILKISWALILFMTLISGYIVYVTVHYNQETNHDFSPKYFAALIALLFVVLGNFINNIKPNYFIGIRTPWALEDGENWRLTHHLGSKMWFFGGLLMLVFVILLPNEYTPYIMPIGLIPMAGIPIVYSYYLFRQKQNTP